jgi:hypothetical protein
VSDEFAEPRVWSVSQVNRAVRLLLESSVDALWVAGEVTNWSRSRPGHCYFTLKDDKAQLRCVLFRAEAELIPGHDAPYSHPGPRHAWASPTDLRRTNDERSDVNYACHSSYFPLRFRHPCGRCLPLYSV